MPVTVHTYFYTPARADSVVRVLQQLTTELKRVEWRVSDHRSVAFSTRRTLFGGAADVRVVATPLAEGGSDVRIALQAPTRRRTTTKAADRLSERIQRALG
ncbi:MULTISPECIES: hypothetical protein [Microbacterium]|jgi:hypothetical protein|uniref:hypothetical protein n=1 Tax=Microbacterium TaxID=33882 RepID=UPI0005ABF707|nr:MULTISPECIES: hypothetical protein [Microbacterium]AQY03111.1 hypothetical protein B2G67_17855 [Microbacterium foliorum]KIP88974.1 hypothetical protein RU09_14090 [Microbacterium sp. MEJ108Y]